MKVSFRKWARFTAILAGCSFAFAATSQELQQVTDAPQFGTFYLLSFQLDGMQSPPYPFDPYGGALPIYQVQGFPNSYLVADSPDDYSALRAQKSANSYGAMSTMDADGPPVPGEGSGGGGGGGGSGFESPVYTTNDLWLEIVSKTNTTGVFVVHPPSSEEGTGVYDLFLTTNLATDVPGLNGTNWEWILRTEPGATNLVVSNLTYDISFFRLGRTNDDDGDLMSTAFEQLVSHTDPNNGDENTNNIPDGWEWAYFGSLQPGDSDYDGDGVSNYQEYLNGTDPNTIKFWLSVTNQYVNNSSVPVALDVVGGVPSSVAVLLDSTNYEAATWTTSSSDVTVNLGSTEGWHDIWIGTRGRLPTSEQNWQWIRVKLDMTVPDLVFTSPTTTTGSQPMIQVQGYSPEPLMRFTYDLANASELVTNEQVVITGQYISTNVWDFTTNYFQAYDVSLAPGTNLITLHATDLAGNTTTTNINFTVSYAGATNPPTVQLDWPQDGAQISGTNFTWSGFVSDPTATITAQIVNTNAETNSVYGFVERDGAFWVENLPLSSGTNTLTLTVTDAASNTTVTNISVIKSTLTLTMNPVTPDSQLWQSTVNVTGTISDASYSVWVNGVQGTNNGDGTWSASDVPITPGSAAKFHVVAYGSGESQP